LETPKSSGVNRYSAKLLFQFRVQIGKDAGKRRLCEERIIVLDARSAKSALAQAKRKGRKAEHHYRNSDGNPVYFEFIGVTDLLRLGVECGPEEVWYDICERLLPMERRDLLIPPEHELNAMRNEV
jgi:hypothetical protein